MLRKLGNATVEFTALPDWKKYRTDNRINFINLDDSVIIRSPNGVNI